MSTHPKHTKSVVIGAAIVVVLFYWIFSDSNEAIPVTLHTIDKGTVEYTVANTRAGTVKACRRANLSPALGGQVKHLYVKEGEKVKKNQLLLEVWNDDLIAQVNLAESELLTSKQSAEEICLMADAAKREAKRVMSLWKEKLTSEEAADKAQTSRQSSEVACKAAQSRVDVSGARLKVAKASLERTRLRAPFAGSIAEINGEIGEYATPSPPGIPTPPAVDIVDTSCLFILAPIDEVDAPNILEGMEARITLDAFPKQHFLGAVRRIAPYVFEVEKQARTVDIEAVFMDENEYKSLKPGYSADLEIILDSRYDVVRAPTEAILEGNHVYIYDEDDEIIQKKSIDVGISNWSYTEVIKGLKPGNKIVVSIDREGVNDGAHVVPEEKEQ